jgi:hypothetical protein
MQMQSIQIKYIRILMRDTFNDTHFSMAKWSKALVKGNSLPGGKSSNLSAAKPFVNVEFVIGPKKLPIFLHNK